MAPQKTMAISQQEQLQQQQNVGTVKPRKRKGNKQQPITNSDHITTQNQPNNNVFECAKSVNNKQQVGNKIENKSNLKSSNHVDNNSSAKQQVLLAQQTARATVKPIEPTQRTSVAQDKPQENQVPKQPVKEAIVPSRVTITAKQLSTEEPDDIDAGIELDGSSNSGSSVKDINEDQSKSASVSPIMAQSNENRSSTTKHAVELAPVEQLAGSLCSNIGPIVKKATTTMQKLAANQEVIEADEQQLQQKMQSKQRASSLRGSLDTNSASNVALNNGNISSASTVVASPQSPALCKICEQHVYQMERVMAEKSVYHKGCFRCHQCKVQLRMDNYSSHEGQVYCKAHHRQLFQPQVKLDNEDDVDIVAKSTSKVVDDYLLQRGRLSELSFSFLNPKPEEMRKRQMIICENEPAELPGDVVRSNTKVDDGIDRLNLNLNNILKRFEQGNGEQEQPSSAGVVIEKPSFDIKKTLMAFETNAVKSENESEDVQEKPKRRVIKKLTNLDRLGFLNSQSSQDNDAPGSGDFAVSNTKPLAVRRSESLMERLKKYESRINGEQVANEDSDVDDESKLENGDNKIIEAKQIIVPKKLTSLKNQWENGDISKRSFDDADTAETNAFSRNEVSDSINGNSPLAEKNEELIRIRQQLARKKSGESASIKNIYENAIKEAQQQKRTTSLNSCDLSALNGFSTTEIQQQLLQNGNKISQKPSTPSSSTPNKDHFRLNLNKRANKLKERFEQGLINNSSIDDSDASNGDDEPTMTKLEQLRQEKLEDLSIFTEGEVKAREARSLFQQIDRRLSAASIGSPVVSNSRSPASISASMSSRLRDKISESNPSGGVCEGDNNINNTIQTVNNATDNGQQQQPIRLTNNVRT